MTTPTPTPIPPAACGPSLWFDATTVVFFPPPVIGIPRVEMSLIRPLIALLNGDANAKQSTHPHQLRFCVYHKTTDRYHEIAQHDLMNYVQRHQSKNTQLQLNADLTIPQDGAPAAHDVFRTGDVFVSLGFNWRENLGNLTKIYAIRQSMGLKVVLCCHDIIPIKYTHFVPGMESYYAPYIAEMGKNADHILCDSHHTRMDLTVWLESQNTTPPACSVFPLGCELQATATASVQIHPIVQDLLKIPYILLVSTIEKRKNHATICQAYTRLIEEGVHIEDLPQLVFVGGIGHGGQELMTDIRSDNRIKNKVTVLSGLGDDDLNLLYNHCRFTVYPSIYEGFGLPIAESLGHGKLCIASNTSSMPEVGGIYAEYADPFSAVEWAEKIALYVTRPQQLAHKEKSIQLGYALPTWLQAAKHVVSVTKNMCDA